MSAFDRGPETAFEARHWRNFIERDVSLRIGLRRKDRSGASSADPEPRAGKLIGCGVSRSKTRRSGAPEVLVTPPPEAVPLEQQRVVAPGCTL